MRLCLRVERNGLPPTQALWPVKDTKSTIAQLLHQVNDIFPLEADTWGLEDYTVSVGGYDCLHYHSLEAVCRDEDEVVISPLQYVDVRARTWTGRNQISADGRHLVDGVPFGRPCIKGPVRPDIRIPPRKKRRLLESERQGGAGGEAVPLMLMEHEEEMDEGEEDDDEEFEMEGSEDISVSEDSTSEDQSGDNSDSESEDSADSESDTGDTSGSNDISGDTSDSESEGSWTGILSMPQRKLTLGLTSGATKPSPNDLPTGSKRKRQSHNGQSAQDHETERRHVIMAARVVVGIPDVGIPNEGKPETKLRNARRRDQKRLKHLIELEVLPQDSTLETLRNWQAENQGVKPVGDRVEMAVNAARKRTTQQLIDDDAAMEDTVVATETVKAEDEMVPETFSQYAEPLGQAGKKSKKARKAKVAAHNEADVEVQRQNLLSAIASGGVDITKNSSHENTGVFYDPAIGGDEENDEPPQEFSSKQEPNGAPREKSASPAEAISKVVDKAMSVMIPPSVARRAKLDLASSKRLLFGSLGVKVPKTQEDRDRLEKKLAEKPKRDKLTNGTDATQADGTVAAAPITNGEPEAEEDSESWHEKIDLTAVECCEEGVTLSTPPFPFYQRWDPQQRKGKTSQRVASKYSDDAGSKRKRKRGNRDSEYVESYDKYNNDGYGDALEYDDVDDGDDDEYWEDGALLDGEYDDNIEEDDGFPTLPAQVDSLPILKEQEAQNNDFITFNELACDESTAWQPTPVSRIAKLVEAPLSGDAAQHWLIQLSKRDLKPKVIDEDGNRVYSKFEMPDDDAEEEGRKWVTWNELPEVKLLLRPDSTADSDA